MYKFRIEDAIKSYLIDPDINYKFGTVEECGLSSDETCIKVINKII